MTTTRVAVITPASMNRLDHLQRQRRFLDEVRTRGVEVVRVEAWLDTEPPPAAPSALFVHVPPGRDGMRVGAARNAAASLALAQEVDLLVFLDVDCLPGPRLIERYLSAAQAHPHDLLCGPVTYLHSVQRPSTLHDLSALTRPHPARPLPPEEATVAAADDEFDLFWSLSFAVTPTTWTRLGGFDDAYEGYGAEDTDLGRRARSLGMRLRWIGGAHAYHQWHPAGSPPWRHLDDILRNGALFADRWGEWPMRGWIDSFIEGGAVEPHGTGYRRVAQSRREDSSPMISPASRLAPATRSISASRSASVSPDAP